MNMITVAHT